ncbi:MAG: tetratricopeptide repeat protein [Bacteroidales bacterium]|nr:tetratricopeptide repeat protein [Bacteroidales bacterium]
MKKIVLGFLLLFACGPLLAQYDKDVFSYRGRLALQDGKYAQAIEQFNILSRLDTTDYWSFFYRGIAKYNLGDLRGARRDFDTAVRLNPVFTNGYHYRAITESRFGQYDRALADLEKAIQLRPGNVGLYYSRGVTFFLAQKFRDALRDFDYFIRKEPKDPSAHLNRGACYLYLGDTLKALTDYNKAIRLDRFEPEGYIRRGRLHAARGDFEDAILDMGQAVELDSTNTFAHFNRALFRYERQDYNGAVEDLDCVLRLEPGNALTLYNRSLIYAQVGKLAEALDDMDRVIGINPGNVLAYYNRASYFIQMGRYRDALRDYDKAIELYPDFAKAYLNRSYVRHLLGHQQESRQDYRIAQQKVQEYRERSADGSFADTTRRYNALIALDADFSKKDFQDELLRSRDIDIRLKPLYRFRLREKRGNGRTALSRRYEHPLLERFTASSPIPVAVTNTDSLQNVPGIHALLQSEKTDARSAFLRGLCQLQEKQYTRALQYFDEAVEKAGDAGQMDPYAAYYKAFYLMSRAALRAEMIAFIASLEGNVQTLSMDEQGTARARVSDRVNRTYDYSEAIADLEEAVQQAPDIPYLHFNLGNLHCLGNEPVVSIGDYGKAIELYPDMGDAYYNRGLVLIYLKDKEKVCIDLSRAGELGITDAYGVIEKYCKTEDL